MNAHTHTKKVPLGFVLLMILMGTVGLVASDIYILAMPQMMEDFATSKQAVQASFTVYLLGLCLGQLFFGSLLDRFNLRNVTIFSLGIFIVSSLLCVFVQTLPHFVLLRFFQAFGASVCSVIYRSLVAARYDRQQTAQILAIIFPIAGLSPAIAPFIGGFLETYWGWRSIFVFTVVYGGLVTTCVLLYLQDDPEAHARPLPVDAVQENRVSGYLRLLRNRHFMGYSLIIAAGFGAFRTYTAESPFIFHNLGFASLEMGYFYLTLSIAYLMGNLLTKKLLNHLEVDVVIKMGLSIMFTGACLMVMVAWREIEGPVAIFLSMSVVTFSNGFLVPCGNAAALTSVPSRMTGVAAALLGTIQLMFAMVCAHYIGDIAQGQFAPLTWVVFGITVLGILSYITFIVRSITKSQLSTIDI